MRVTRASILFRKKLLSGWIAGSSPAMTSTNYVPRGFTRRVGMALAGSSGQGWRG